MARSPNARRRPRGQSNASATQNQIRIPDARRSNANGVSTPQKQAAVPARTEVGMSPVSRYNSNLRILRRRDPHILSIFDQFPHACAYYFSLVEQKWERMGYEGALFLFERDIEPRYGFFILNRVGMEDLLHYLVPSDKLTPQGEYLCIEYKETATESAQGAPLTDRLPSTMSLWTLPTDTRESLADVMVRVLDCTKSGVPYPQECRFGPEMVVRSTFVSSNVYDGDYGDEDTSASDEGEVFHDALSASASTNSVVRRALDDARAMSHGPSELDQLFAKLEASKPAASRPTTTATQPTQTRQVVPPATTANSILEMLSRGNQAPTEPQAPLTGHALLNNMFASVANASGQTAQQPATQPQNFAQFRFPTTTATVASPPEDMEILSPKPNNAALPQILTADVIHELMGFPSSSSRSASCTSTSASEQSRSAGSAQPASYAPGVVRPHTPSSAGAPRSKERGYIADRGEDDGGVSEASTGFEAEPLDGYADVQNRGLGTRMLGARSSFLSATSTGSNNSLKGDVTPRAPHGRSLESMPSNLSLNSQKSNKSSISHVISSSGTGAKAAPSTSARTVPPTTTTSAPAPFQASSELWPETQGTRRSEQNGNGGDTEEVVELDFSDIRVLDDPHAFGAKGARGRSMEKGTYKESGKARNEVVTQPKDGERSNNVHLSAPTSPPANARERPRGKTTKPEKDLRVTNASILSSSSQGSTPAEAVSPRKLVNGNSSPSITSASKRTAQSSNSATLSPELAKDVLLNEVFRTEILSSKSDGHKLGRSAALDRNTFMQQILTLIHTDKSFVDKLYQSYLDHA